MRFMHIRTWLDASKKIIVIVLFANDFFDAWKYVAK